MADPVSMLAITSMVATGAGAGISAFGAEKTAAAQSAQYNYQAGLAQQNALLAKQDANYALDAGEVEAQQAGMKGRFQTGSTRAGFGASNVSGASQDRVLSSETAITQDNESLIRSNAAKRAFGFEVKGAEDTAQSSIYTTAAETSRQAGDISAISTIIGGVGQVASKWMQYGQYFGGGADSTGAKSNDLGA